jgi:RimJ/RimL family protein N-acetyltransferase
MIAPEMAYPAELARDVTLADGARVHVRPIRADDETRLVALYERLRERTAYQRFFATKRRLPPNWERFLADLDYVGRLALVATLGAQADAELIAVARYEPTADAGVVEVAFVVQDAWQNRGLGTVLCRALLGAGTARGITEFRASVLADNPRMLDMIARLGDIRERRTEHGVIELRFSARTARPAHGEDTTRDAIRMPGPP